MGSFIDVATNTNAPSGQGQVTQSPEYGVSAALTSYFPRCDALPCRNCLPQRTK